MYLPLSTDGTDPFRRKDARRLGFRAAFSVERNPACVQTARAAQEANGVVTSPGRLREGRNVVSLSADARVEVPGLRGGSRSTIRPYVPVHEIIRPFYGRRKAAA
jgi:hypothetical protein